MTSCPDDRELLELVDGELSPARAESVTEHLAECGACRVSLGRSEAALAYAVGGLSDTGRWTSDRVPAAEGAASARRHRQSRSHPQSHRHPHRRGHPYRQPHRQRRLLAISAAAIAATLLLAAVLDVPPQSAHGAKATRETATGEKASSVGATNVDPRPAELHRLLARVEQLRDEADAPDGGRDLVATAALAAAEARAWTVGKVAARPHVENVIERFPQTTAARQARVLLASDAWRGDLR